MELAEDLSSIIHLILKDDEGKILYLQYYGDFTSAFLSLEE